MSEYLFTALRTGSIRYSFATESVPPMTIISGLNMLISPAMALPSVWPTESSTSMASTSSLSRASRMSLSVISTPFLNFSESIDTRPCRSFSRKMRCRAEPEAPVSRHPRLPQRQMISLSSSGKCPNSPEKPDLP